MPSARYIACDLGAEACRVFVATLNGEGRLTVEEIRRFATPVVRLPGPSVRWDVLAVYGELKAAMATVARRGKSVAGVAVSSWGVDYAYTAAGQPLLWPPYHHRDPRTSRTYGPIVEQLGADYIFGRTGGRFAPFNTLYQLAADVADHPRLLKAARDLLLVGDYVNFLLSGVVRAEETLASTTQAFDVRDRVWAYDLIDVVGLPPTLFPAVVAAGTVLGPLLADVAAETGLAATVPVIAACSQDAAAVAAVPAESADGWAYLCSAAASVVGVELDDPVVTPAARAAGFTNEAGVGGTVRFQMSVPGLFLLTELRRAWAAAGQPLGLAEVVEFAAMNDGFRSLVDPADARFAGPCDMPAAIAAYCAETGQPVPESPGQFARCALESLALQYRATLADLEALSGRRVARLHVIGGGSGIPLLSQFTADATGRTVVAGPTDPVPVGNALVQAMALGHVSSVAAARRVVRASFPVATFEPAGGDEWAAAHVRFAQLTGRV